MNETEKYIAEQIKTGVWGGFESKEDVLQMIEDLIRDEGEADGNMLQKVAASEFQKKLAAERTWPVSTDCDRLDDAFVDLNGHGIIALHKTGMTMSDGHEDVSAALHERGRAGVMGYCFYHGQDLERAVQGMGLYLAFGDLKDTDEGKVRVGELIKSTMERHGLGVSWNGEPDTRLHVEKMDWKRRAER